MVYTGDDELDIRLLNKLSKFIIFQRLDVVAEHLGFTYAEFSQNIFTNKTPQEKIFHVGGFKLSISG